MVLNVVMDFESIDLLMRGHPAYRKSLIRVYSSQNFEDTPETKSQQIEKKSSREWHFQLILYINIKEKM